MSGVSVRWTFSDSDRAKFQRNMDRMTRDLGISPQETIRIGVITYLKSVRASTKQAPKRRKVLLSRSGRGTRITDKIGHSKKIYYAIALDRQTGGARNIPIFARSASEAKEDPKAQIRRWGLAKQSWGWMMHSLYGQALGDSPNPAAVEKPGMVEVSKRIDIRAGYAEASLENRLNYIVSAMGSRVPADTALARANSSMEASIQAKVDKATREAGF